MGLPHSSITAMIWSERVGCEDIVPPRSWPPNVAVYISLPLGRDFFNQSAARRRKAAVRLAAPRVDLGNVQFWMSPASAGSSCCSSLAANYAASSCSRAGALASRRRATSVSRCYSRIMASWCAANRRASGAVRSLMAVRCVEKFPCAEMCVDVAAADLIVDASRVVGYRSRRRAGSYS
jgi:hypothetical protein